MDNTVNIIEQQENKDRFVATKVLNKIYSNNQLTLKGTPLKCSVDLKGSVIIKNELKHFNVEIKERYKDSTQLAKYPNAELKLDKLNRMRAETPSGTTLLYMVLLNEEKCLIFNLDKLDWDDVPLKNWWIKRTLVDPNSDYISTPTYFIPYSAAIVTMNCKDFFYEYYLKIKKCPL